MSVTTLRPRDDREILRSQLTKMSGEFRMALPSHISADKFQRTIMTAAQQNPDILAADRRTLLMAATKCATDGLLPDGREAAFVIFNTKIKDENGKDKWVKAVQYIPMLAGLQKRARNTGQIAGLIAQVVYENDEFVQKPDDFETPILHRPPPLGQPRGEALGAYAIAKLKDGTIISEVMDSEQIAKVMAVSRSRDRNGNIVGPWKDWREEMWRKTVFRRLSKWLPTDAEIGTGEKKKEKSSFDQVASRDDETPDEGETTRTIDAVLTDDQRAIGTSRLDALEGAIDPPEMDGEAEFAEAPPPA
jgi:recombination protein RecT